MPKGRAEFVGPAHQLLLDAANTYRDRRATYGASEQMYADVMETLFPKGLTLNSHSDWVRFGLFSMIISKVTRYANNFAKPHIDSVHDLGVYAFMLEAEDRGLL